MDDGCTEYFIYVDSCYWIIDHEIVFIFSPED